MSDEVKQIAALEKALGEQHKTVTDLIEKATGQIQETGKVCNDLKAGLDKEAAKAEEICKRIDKVEAKLDGLSDVSTKAVKSMGERVTESKQFAEFKSGDRRSFKINFQGDDYKAIVNATGQNQPLVPAERLPGILTEPNRRLTIRDLIPKARTSSNFIEIPKENVFTDNSGPQAGNSPTEYENVTKGESDATFTLDTCPVTTYAHFIRASTQVLADATQLNSYINGRMMYFLKLKEEADLLTGDGASGRLRGLWRYGTPYNRGTPTGDTRLDTLRKAKLELALRNYQPEGYILNPADWDVIEGQKDADRRYIYGDPSRGLQPTIWGLPVVLTNSMPEGSFLCAQFSVASTLWDREDASLAMSTEDSTNFQTNMVTIRVEERLAHVVYLPLGISRGSFENSPIS